LQRAKHRDGNPFAKSFEGAARNASSRILASAVRGRQFDCKCPNTFPLRCAQHAEYFLNCTVLKLRFRALSLVYWKNAMFFPRSKIASRIAAGIR
jgi:hypothetical protein